MADAHGSNASATAFPGSAGAGGGTAPRLPAEGSGSQVSGSTGKWTGDVAACSHSSMRVHDGRSEAKVSAYLYPSSNVDGDMGHYTPPTGSFTFVGVNQPTRDTRERVFHSALHVKTEPVYPHGGYTAQLHAKTEPVYPHGGYTAPLSGYQHLDPPFAPALYSAAPLYTGPALYTDNSGPLMPGVEADASDSTATTDTAGKDANGADSADAADAPIPMEADPKPARAKREAEDIVTTLKINVKRARTEPALVESEEMPNVSCERLCSMKRAHAIDLQGFRALVRDDEDNEDSERIRQQETHQCVEATKRCFMVAEEACRNIVALHKTMYAIDPYIRHTRPSISETFQWRKKLLSRGVVLPRTEEEVVVGVALQAKADGGMEAQSSPATITKEGKDDGTTPGDENALSRLGAMMVGLIRITATKDAGDTAVQTQGPVAVGVEFASAPQQDPVEGMTKPTAVAPALQ